MYARDEKAEGEAGQRVVPVAIDMQRRGLQGGRDRVWQTQSLRGTRLNSGMSRGNAVVRIATAAYRDAVEPKAAGEGHRDPRRSANTPCHDKGPNRHLEAAL